MEGLKGLEAISSYNGWAMAIVGATIVFMGLVVLSTAISQIHRLLMVWDDRERYTQLFKNSKANIFNNTRANSIDAVDNQLIDIKKTAQLYAPLIDQLGKTFQLADLYATAEQNKMPHPHLTITKLRNEKILIPQGDGTFMWNF